MTNVRYSLSLAFLLALAYAAVLFLAKGAIRPDLLCQWDCGWYRAIATHGYVSTIPPIAQAPDQSNVAFFPLYPYLGREVMRLFGTRADTALPILSILFAFGIFYFSARILDLRQDPLARKKLLLLAAYPASFYFFVGYSESLYVFLLLLCWYAASRERAWLPILALAAFFLGLTRLTGFVIGGGMAGLALIGSFYFRERRWPSAWVWGVFSFLGVLTFLIYCQQTFGAWDLYFRTLEIGWSKEASSFGFIKYFLRALVKNVFPFWFAKDPTRLSWVIVADLLLALGYVLVTEGRRVLRAPERAFRYFLVAAMFVHLMISTLGDSGEKHRWGNGMRYAMPVFYVLVLLGDEEWVPAFLRTRPKLRKGVWYGLLALFVPYQIYYFYLFTIGRWVS